MLPLAHFCLTPLHLAAHVADPPPLAGPRAAAARPVVCVDPTTLARRDDVSGSFTETRETEHFLLAWDPANSAVTEAAIDTYASALETSWTTQIDQMGWRAPDQTDACLMTVLIAEFDESWGDTGGYTDVVETGGVPYMVLNTAWLEYGDTWTQTLAAHEFNHASQFGYNVFWEESDWWYWESTAEWMSDVVFDDANTYTWSLWAYLDAPWLALSSMQATVQYGHLAFNTHLTALDGDDAPRAVWEAADEATLMEDAASNVMGVPFDDLVTGYTSRVAALEVDEQDVWLEAIGYFEIDRFAATVDTYPAEGAGSGREAPQARGQNFLHFTGTPGGDVVLSFAGAADVDGEPTNWAVTVATEAPGGVTHTVVQADEQGAADVVIVGLGDDVSDAYVGLVPLGAIGANGADYTWTATVTPAEDEVPDEEEPAACGCTTTAPITGAWGLLVAALVARRRARS
jgi:hypothetical protein